jgi:hypothetical protein
VCSGKPGGGHWSQLPCIGGGTPGTGSSTQARLSSARGKQTQSEVSEQEVPVGPSATHWPMVQKPLQHSLPLLQEAQFGRHISHGPSWSPWRRWASTALWETSLVSSSGVPGLWQMVTFCCLASAREGISAAMAVPAKSFSARRRLIEPSASALASSSKERLVVCWLTCCPIPRRAGLGD